MKKGFKRLIRVFSVELRNAVFSKAFLLAIVIIILGCLSGAATELTAIIKDFLGYPTENALDMFSLVQGVFLDDNRLMALTIAVSLPYTMQFIDDMGSGYVKNYLPRAGRKNYLLIRPTICALSGGLATACSVVIAVMIIIVIFAIGQGHDAASIINNTRMVFSFFSKDVLLMIAGGMLYANVGLFVSAVTMNKFSALASPFVIYYLLRIIAGQYLRSFTNKPEYFNPNSYFNSQTNLYGSFTIKLIVVLVICMLIGAAYVLIARRRINKQI